MLTVRTVLLLFSFIHLNPRLRTYAMTCFAAFPKPVFYKCFPVIISFVRRILDILLPQRLCSRLGPCFDAALSVLTLSTVMLPSCGRWHRVGSSTSFEVFHPPKNIKPSLLDWLYKKALSNSFHTQNLFLLTLFLNLFQILLY